MRLQNINHFAKLVISAHRPSAHPNWEHCRLYLLTKQTCLLYWIARKKDVTYITSIENVVNKCQVTSNMNVYMFVIIIFIIIITDTITLFSICLLGDHHVSHIIGVIRLSQGTKSILFLKIKTGVLGICLIYSMFAIELLFDSLLRCFG